MKILDYAWSTFSSISGADQEKFRLVLSETAQRPTIGLEDAGYVVKLPLPRKEKETTFSVQGLYADADEQSWPVLWSLFRASLSHAAFHLLYSDMKTFSRWAKGKDLFPAIYSISLLEDYRITMAARPDWPGVLGDIAYANYIGALRMGDLDDIESRALRFASKLLLALWGVSAKKSVRVDEDREVLALAERARGLVESSLESGNLQMLVGAADDVYQSFAGRSVLPQIPAFPHTEAHSGDSLFSDHIEVSKERDEVRLRGALNALGLSALSDDDQASQAEFKEAFQAIEDSEARRARMREYYQKLAAKTKLTEIVFPQGDYSAFLRTRAELAGPIRNIKNQLLQLKNVLDEEQGKESGQVDVPMAMQVVASGQLRSDVFIREEPLLKDEAWAILVDSSKSVSNSSMQLRGITTCLAEVANAIMAEKSRWGLFGFNDTFQIVKDFDEPYWTEAKARIGGMSQRGATFIPDALVMAAKSLGARPIENKFMVVVSDCLPTGYSGIEQELVARAEEIAKKGINLVGIGVQSSEVKKYFKVNSVLSTPYEMMKFFVRSYLELSAAS